MLIDSTLKLCVVEYLCMFLSVLNGMTLEDKTHHLASTWKGLSINSDNQTREQMLKDKKMLRLKRKIIKLDLWWRSDPRVSNSEFPVMSTKGTQRQTPVKRLHTSYAGNPHLEQPWINWKGHLECHKLSLIDATRGQFQVTLNWTSKQIIHLHWAPVRTKYHHLLPFRHMPGLKETLYHRIFSLAWF